MIPRHNELKLQHKIVKELKALGGDELVNKFMSLCKTFRLNLEGFLLYIS